ncbi:MAG TPA: hypothetical protein VFI23_07990 [Rhizomicrobium sp.]|nr:hypothetical protein [Rhizomicrobium sp.]
MTRWRDYFWVGVAQFFTLRGPFFLSIFISLVILNADQFEEIIRGVAWSRLGAELLPSHHYWWEMFATRPFAGLALGSLGCAALLWFWARFTVSSLGRTTPPQKPGVLTCSRYLPPLAGMLPLLALSLASLNAVLDKGRALENPQSPDISAVDSALYALAVTFLLLAILFGRAAMEGHVANPASAELARRHPRLHLVLRLNGPARFLLGVSLGGWLLCFIGFAVAPQTVWAYLGRESLLFVWAGFTAAPLSLVCLIATKTRIPLIGLAGLFAFLLAAFNFTDNHKLKLAPGFDARAAEAPLEVRQDFPKWLASRPDMEKYKGSAYPVYLVAAEGGGIRAEYMTALTLSVIQDLCPRFRDHLYIISSVSGGSVGAGFFSALLRKHSREAPEDFSRCATRVPDKYCMAAHLSDPTHWFAPRALRAAGADSLTGVLGTMLFDNAVQLFIPYPISWLDRGRAQIALFERAYNRAIGETRDCAQAPGNDLCMAVSGLSRQAGVPNGGGDLPRMIFNTTRVEDGTPAPVTPLKLSADQGLSGGWVLARNMLRADAIAVSSAMSMSSRFPWVSPAARLRPEQLRPLAKDLDFIPDPPPATFRVADGGYYENSGIGLLPEMVLDLSAETLPVEPDFHLLILTNDAAVTNGRGTKPIQGDPKPPSPHGFGDFNELVSPLRTALNTRGGHGAIARKRLSAIRDFLKRNEDVRNAAGEFDFDEIRIGCGNIPIPLGWYLTDAAKDELGWQVLGNPPACPPGSGAGAPNAQANRDAINHVLNMLQ